MDEQIENEGDTSDYTLAELNEVIEILKKQQYSLSLNFTPLKNEAWVCHETWISKDLNQSVPLPVFEGDTVQELLKNVMRYFGYNRELK